jgi:uncharacterized membrane-anchored protein YitT (DUF2179 family)
MVIKGLHIFLGCFLIGIGINGFFVPHRLLDGGMIGLGLILHYTIDIPVGLTMIFLSIPLYLYAWTYERPFFFHSLIGLVSSSLCIDSLRPLSEWIVLPLWISAPLGGSFVGIGIGLMLIVHTSTGGTDLLAQCISKAYKWNVGLCIFIIDTVVLCIGWQIVGTERFLFSLLSVSVIGFFTSYLTTNITYQH